MPRTIPPPKKKEAPMRNGVAGYGKPRPMKAEEIEAREKGFSCGQSIQPMGGHLIDPPLECEYRRYASDGGVWTDYGCCMSHCGAHCKTYLRDKRMSDADRRTRMIRKGVRDVWSKDEEDLQDDDSDE